MSTSPILPYFTYWGKLTKEDEELPRKAHLLPYHCLDVAAVGHVLLERNPGLLQRLSAGIDLTQDHTHSLLLLFLALHDVGKFSQSFQGLCPGVLGQPPEKQKKWVYSHRHDSLGLALWNGHLQPFVSELEAFDVDEQQRIRLGRLLEPLACAVFGHHGFAADVEYIDITDHFTDQDMETVSRFTHDVADLFVKSPIHLPADLNGFYRNLRSRSWLCAGFVVVCDWIGSNRDYFSLQETPEPLDQYWATACRQAGTAVESAGILPERARAFQGMGELFPDLETAQPSPLQSFVTNCALPSGPQLWIIEDITGSGKTEAALILTHRLMQQGAEGFFIALPTMATSNAMYERMEAAYGNLFVPEGRPSLVLAHGKRHLMERFLSSILDIRAQYSEKYVRDETEASAQCSQWIADNRKKAFLAHAGVGTIDQCLLAVLPSKFHALRLFGLAGKVLIVDEVHACDAYMAGVLEALLRFHASLGGSAILLSATIPHQMRLDFANAFSEGLGIETDPSEIGAFPMVTSVSAERVQAFPVEPRPDLHRSISVQLVHDLDSVLDEIESAGKSGATVCWVRNTVGDAIEAYELLRERKVVPRDRLLLFHARFAMGHRLEREAEVIQRFGKHSQPEHRKGCVLIATQVVEQSLDLDFDFMVSDLAPIDLLIQRAGRVWRHGRAFRGNRHGPVLWVLSPEVTESPGPDWFSGFLCGASIVYPEHGNLWRTARLLHERRGWTVPEDARDLIECVYNDEHGEPIPEGLLERKLSAEGDQMAFAAQARANVLDAGAGYGDSFGPAFADTSAPTRLGEPSITIRLAQRRNGRIIPICDTKHQRWMLSEIQVRESQIAASAETEQDRHLAAATMSDKGKWCEIIILEPQQDDTWTGVACKQGENKVEVTYSLQTGLQIDQERK